MKVVTYNVNGLRSRISQFGSLLKLLDSFDADIICFQETKLRRQELTADLVMADGYESFFSCTRTSERGRLGYSGVATFCRVKSAFSSSESALPVAAEEGFTGILENSRNKKDDMPAVMEGLEDCTTDELNKIDKEGRCVITDHGHFVLFNIYGPRAECDDAERIQFKHKFYKILQKRWELLLRQERRVFVVGDFNIAPAAIDRCEAGPDFEKNEFRRWLRSILVEGGGFFYDVFRAKHPERREAYTCWPQNSGAEEFNYGSRIDLILSGGPCLHQDGDLQGHKFMNCHVKECDILMQYSRWKPGNTPRRKGGISLKREGSDHAPVYMCLMDIPEVPEHSTPSLSSRYLPMIQGLQQTIVSVLMKRQAAEQVETSSPSSYFKSSNPECNGVAEAEDSRGSIDKAAQNAIISPGNEHTSGIATKKKARKGQWSQLSLKSFFQKNQTLGNCRRDNSASVIISEDENVSECNSSQEIPLDDESNSEDQLSTQDEAKVNVSSSGMEKSNTAMKEWQRIQQVMQNSLPLCKGHKEACVARVVKKSGPNFGRRFYVCARSEGPSSNPEANCGYFKWAASKSKQK